MRTGNPVNGRLHNEGQWGNALLSAVYLPVEGDTDFAWG